MKHWQKLIIGLLYCLHSNLYANGLNMHITGGVGWTHFRTGESLYLNSSVENFYATSTSTQYSPIVGAGAGYQWDKLFSKKSPISFNLGLSAYYSKYIVSGVSYPLINVGTYDTLNYSASNNAFALLLEPKLIYTHHQWQPYLLGGIGLGFNRLMSYAETPTNPNLSAAPMPLPFGNKTNTHFAYELGLGIQTLLFKIKPHDKVNFFADYRYINWGKMSLAASPLQTTRPGLVLGYLRTQQITMGLEYQFA